MFHFRAALMNATVDHALSCEQIHRFDPPYDAVFLDHDLGGRQLEDHEDCGATFCRLLVERGLLGSVGRVVIHSYNAAGAIQMLSILSQAGVSAEYLPFGGHGFEDALAVLGPKPEGE
jgi:hypothetical protein